VSSSLKNILVAAFAVAIPLTLSLPGCGSDDSSGGGGSGNVGNTGGTGTGGTTNTGGTGNVTGICLLNNCKSNEECAGCSFGRTTCKISENRCVACDPSSGLGCPAGQECTSFGTCAPAGLTCPTDTNGEPTISCQANADCQACDPLHQICDPAKGKCVACTDTNTSQCSLSDICIDNKCAHKCPDSCTQDNDCMRCEYTDEAGTPKKAKACYNHVCSECSDTYSCPVGLTCQKGTCVKPCGLIGQSAGTCNTDADCGGCGAAGGPAWKCKFPINGGLHGVCTAPATGCSDLGQGAVLPAPYDKVTNLCSNDNDCANIGIDYNVGQAIRDLVGGPELDIGIKKIKIQDANIKYGMKKCASIELVNNVKCGVCVPCKVDSDCADIKLDTLVFDLFKGDPLAQIAGAFLLDLLFGKDNDPALHFQCLNVAAGYGICIPCSNPTKACGSTGGSGTGSCDHDVCSAGGPLKADCGSCATEVCKNDSYCCTTQWDQVCIDETKKYCANGCGGTGTTTCDHDPCTSGKALNTSCSTCVSTVCGKDPYCCSTSWDSTCVSEAQGEAACASACGGGCAHSECSTGGPLKSTCSGCATSVCGSAPYCCNTDWDTTCVNEAKADNACSCN